MSETKICTRCHRELPLSEFSRFYCRECTRELNREQYAKFKEARKQKAREHYSANAERCKAQKREYTQRISEEDPNILRERYASADARRREEHNAQRRERYQRDREMLLLRQAKYRDEHREELRRKNRESIKQRRQSDPLYKLKLQVRGMVRDSFTRFSHRKNAHAAEIIGMPTEIFCRYLIDTFQQTYGRPWDFEEPVHIDHIIPLSAATTEAEIYALCHYNNLRLIKAEDNLRKGAKQDYQIKKEI